MALGLCTVRSRSIIIKYGGLTQVELTAMTKTNVNAPMRRTWLRTALTALAAAAPAGSLLVSSSATSSPSSPAPPSSVELVSQTGDIGEQHVVMATPSGAGKTWKGLLYGLAMLVLGIFLTFGLYALIVLVGRRRGGDGRRHARAPDTDEERS